MHSIAIVRTILDVIIFLIKINKPSTFVEGFLAFDSNL